MNGSPCPNCRKVAPLVYRGVAPYCTACGAPRMPLVADAVNLAGKPTKFGGAVARVFGWTTLAVGLVVGFGLFAACGAVVGFSAAAPYLFGLPIAIVSAVVGWLLVRSGNELREAGEKARTATQLQAVFALAQARGGVLGASDLSHAIQVSTEEADTILTTLAKRDPEQVTIDVNDDGDLVYRFPQIQLSLAGAAANAARSRTRIKSNPAISVRVATPSPAAPIEIESDENSETVRQRRH